MYNPATGIFGAAGSLAVGRSQQTATVLSNGGVLIAGGIAGSDIAIVEGYNPSIPAFGVVGTMSIGRFGHTATVLSNGAVLIVGGSNTTVGDLATAELSQ